MSLLSGQSSFNQLFNYLPNSKVCGGWFPRFIFLVGTGRFLSGGALRLRVYSFDCKTLYFLVCSSNCKKILKKTMCYVYYTFIDWLCRACVRGTLVANGHNTDHRSL